ncbi:MAG: flagellar motor switch protein FliN [Holophagaceae bacterium]|nr:flagellar motor switch protein FliN [Holophagaceae bacterium]
MKRTDKSDAEKTATFIGVISDLMPVIDTPFRLNINLGETKMTIQDLLDLEVGSIVELKKSAGEPMDVLVRNRAIMKGEVTVLEDSLGLRIVEIIDISRKV